MKPFAYTNKDLEHLYNQLNGKFYVSFILILLYKS